MVAGLFVVLLATSLVLDRLWIDAAEVEILTTAEGSALAAARALASDDLLTSTPDSKLRIDLARKAALQVAASNTAAGSSNQYSIDPNEIRIGQWILDSGGLPVFIEETTESRTVILTARRQRSRANPIARIWHVSTGHHQGDVIAQAEATVNNILSSLKPTSSIRIPAMPLAIYLNDPTDTRLDTWTEQIINRRGPDLFKFDAATRTILSQADGIPEIVLHPPVNADDPTTANLVIADVGNGFDDQTIAEHITLGWDKDALADWNGEFPIAPDDDVDASPNFQPETLQTLSQAIGQTRICLLYSSVTSPENTNTSQARLAGVIAVRIMSVTITGDSLTEIVVQPAILVTPTATASHDDSDERNPYIYKLELTR